MLCDLRAKLDAVGRRSIVLNATAALLVVTGGAAVAVTLGDDGGRPVAAVVPDSAPEPPVAVPTTTATPAAAATPTGTARSEKRTPVPPVAAPTRLSIPSIGVDDSLITVGLTEDGKIEVPQGKQFDKPAWLRTGPRPGQIGPAVIEGHVDSFKGPSVFHRLAGIKRGQEAQVERQDGSTVTFVVYDVRSFPKDEFPTAAVYGISPGPELRLLTCGGEFDRAAKRYLNNIVVFARAK
jgi:hypothetical protein